MTPMEDINDSFIGTMQKATTKMVTRNLSSLFCELGLARYNAHFIEIHLLRSIFMAVCNVVKRLFSI